MMVFLGILGGWFVLSCVTAPFIGRFIAVNASMNEDTPVFAKTQPEPELELELEPPYHAAGSF
jgi:hypothetical protein